MEAISRGAAPWAACTVLVAGAAALAEPQPGRPLPGFSISDLEGRWHGVAELRGHRSALIAITGPGAGASMDRWLAAFRALDPHADARTVALIALRVTRLAPDSLIWDRARAQAPRARWPRIWLSRDGNVQSALGLPDNNSVPYVFVLGEDGRVLLSLHADAGTAAVRSAWGALTNTAAAP